MQKSESSEQYMPARDTWRLRSMKGPIENGVHKSPRPFHTYTNIFRLEK